MAINLSTEIQNQIDTQHIKPVYIFKVNDIDYSDRLLLGFNVSFSKDFGSASGNFQLSNDDFALFQGAQEINEGDIVEFNAYFNGDTTIFPIFYGYITQVIFDRSPANPSIRLTCLDELSRLKNFDIDYSIYGDTVKVTDEKLKPNYLASPNENLAQIFDFANNAISSEKPPIILIKKTGSQYEELQDDGFEILYSQGQLKLGSPINARYNYEVWARSYYFYISGVKVEDVIFDILTTPDAYGNYLFNKRTKQELIDEHLTATWSELESDYDILTPNTSDSTIKFKTSLVADYTPGDGINYITIENGTGYPTYGTGEINGDLFSWTSKVDLSNDMARLVGIPNDDDDKESLSAKSANSTVIYESTYPAGQVWYFKYSKIKALDITKFIMPPDVTILHLDLDAGQVVLSKPISIYSTILYADDYSFSTIQSSGVEINGIKFHPRTTETRYDAIKQLLSYLTPNYTVRTDGSKKIYASYMYQRLNADYELKLKRSMNYFQDSDVYTRTVFYAYNSEPTNLVLGNEAVDFVTTGEEYRAIANYERLIRDDDLSTGNFYVYKPYTPGIGRIDLGDYLPEVFVNDILIDNKTHQVVQAPVYQDFRNTTEVRTGCHGLSFDNYVKSHTYYYYTLVVGHKSIDPRKPIYFHNANGQTILTLTAFDQNFNYANGVYVYPSTDKNEIVEQIATATYSVLYSSDKLKIDYDNALFYINKSIVPDQLQTAVINANFQYWAVLIPINDVASIIDGRWDTQVQVEFYSPPPSGYRFAILDLGKISDIQAIDITGGYYRPDDIRKFGLNMYFNLKYSTDGVEYFTVGATTSNFQLESGKTTQFNEEDLGAGFQARYLMLEVETLEPIDYSPIAGIEEIYVAAIAEVSVYDNIVVKSESKLITATTTTAPVYLNSGESTTITVESTEGFDTPASGERATAYLGEDEFTYSAKDDTHFYDCEGVDFAVDTGAPGIATPVQVPVGACIFWDSDTYGDLVDEGWDEIVNNGGLIKIAKRHVYTEYQHRHNIVGETSAGFSEGGVEVGSGGQGATKEDHKHGIDNYSSYTDNFPQRLLKLKIYKKNLKTIVNEFPLHSILMYESSVDVPKGWDLYSSDDNYLYIGADREHSHLGVFVSLVGGSYIDAGITTYATEGDVSAYKHFHTFNSDDIVGSDDFDLNSVSFPLIIKNSDAQDEWDGSQKYFYILCTQENRLYYKESQYNDRYLRVGSSIQTFEAQNNIHSHEVLNLLSHLGVPSRNPGELYSLEPYKMAFQDKADAWDTEDQLFIISSTALPGTHTNIINQIIYKTFSLWFGGQNKPANNTTNVSHRHTLSVEFDEVTTDNATNTSFLLYKYEIGKLAPYKKSLEYDLPEGVFIGTRVSKELADDSDIYDYTKVLARQGDVLYKSVDLNSAYMYSQTQLDRVARGYLQEFLKNHTKVQVDCMFAPYLKLGQTVRLIEEIDNVDKEYFIEQLNIQGNSWQITIGEYPR